MMVQKLAVMVIMVWFLHCSLYGQWWYRWVLVPVVVTTQPFVTQLFNYFKLGRLI